MAEITGMIAYTTMLHTMTVVPCGNAGAMVRA